PPLIFGGLWALFNYSVNGTFLPNTYYVKHAYELGYFNAKNLGNIFSGYILTTSPFSGIMLIFMLAALIGGGIYLYSRKCFKALVLLSIIPLSQVYALSINIRVAASGWSYFTRRYLDDILPFAIIFLVLGAVSVWQEATHFRRRVVVLGLP